MTRHRLARRPEPPAYPPRIYAAVVTGAIGLTMAALGVTGTGGWRLVAPGIAVVIAAIAVVWPVLASVERRPPR